MGGFQGEVPLRVFSQQQREVCQRGGIPLVNSGREISD